MNVQSSAPKLTVNVKNTIALLASTFSNSTIFLNELMQNARRAGATEIDFTYSHAEASLIITDNGKGIDDFANLLTIGQSGWDENIQRTESPYGAGFLSAIMACESGFVESNGYRLDWVTEALIDNHAPMITPIQKTQQTVIGLNGIGKAIPDFYSDTVRRALGVACLGFPVKVTYDGVRVGNNDAENNPHADGFTETYEGLGTITFCKDRTPRGINFYLQGLPVCNYSNTPLSSTTRQVTVHLDPTIYKGRMPDRTEILGITAKALRETVEKKYFEDFSEKLFKSVKGNLANPAVFDFIYEHNSKLLVQATALPGKLFVEFSDDIKDYEAVLQPYAGSGDRWDQVRYNSVSAATFENNILLNALPDCNEDREGTKALFLSRLSEENEVTFLTLKERQPSLALLPSWVPAPLSIDFDTDFLITPNLTNLQSRTGVIGELSSTSTQVFLAPEGYEVTLAYLDDDGETLIKPLKTSVQMNNIDWYDYERDILIVCSDLSNLSLSVDSLFKQTDEYTESEYDGSDCWDWDEDGINDAVSRTTIAIRSLFGDEEGADKLTKEKIHSHLRDALYKHHSELKGKTLTLKFGEKGFLDDIEW